MQRSHFEAFRPVCPRCRIQNSTDSPLIIGEIFRADEQVVTEGVLQCGNPACSQQFPIVDGIPVIVPEVAALLSAQINQILNRGDLHEATLSMIGDAAGDASEFNTRRQHLSIYGWDGYAEFLDSPDNSDASPGAVARCLEKGLALLDRIEGPVVDLGCAVGRSTFELAARTDQPVLGIDLSFAMLQTAQQVQRTGVARIPLRQTGVLYAPMTATTPFRGQPNADFWLCDAMALPLPTGTARFVNALNLLDCVPSPLALLRNIEALLATGGSALLGSPYDWSSGATPIEHWIGGHSEHSNFQGSSERLLEALLTPGAHPQSLQHLHMVASEGEVPWQTRLHARSLTRYRMHLMALARS